MHTPLAWSCVLCSSASLLTMHSLCRRLPLPPQELRALLQASMRTAEGADVFALLFASWSHSCAASLALALLALGV